MQHIVVAAADVAALSCTLRLRLDQLDARSLLFCLTHLALPLSLFSRSLSRLMWNACGTSLAALRLHFNFVFVFGFGVVPSSCWGGRSPPSFGCNWNAVAVAVVAASTAQWQRIFIE